MTNFVVIKEPTVELDVRYSTEGAQPTPWEEARETLAEAEVYWLSTVRADGRPHVTPVIGVWFDNALYFTTGLEEQKAKNLAQNGHCVITTGCNSLNEGLDLVVEGEAQWVTDDTRLVRIADQYEGEYGRSWHFDVHDGAFHHEGGASVVFELVPETAYG